MKFSIFKNKSRNEQSKNEQSKNEQSKNEPSRNELSRNIQSRNESNGFGLLRKTPKSIYPWTGYAPYSKDYTQIEKRDTEMSLTSRMIKNGEQYSKDKTKEERKRKWNNFKVAAKKNIKSFQKQARQLNQGNSGKAMHLMGAGGKKFGGMLNEEFNQIIGINTPSKRPKKGRGKSILQDELNFSNVKVNWKKDLFGSGKNHNDILGKRGRKRSSRKRSSGMSDIGHPFKL